MYGLLVLLCLTGVVVLLIRTPYVQQKVTDRAASYLSTKTGGTFSVERLFLTFDFNVQIEGLAAFTPNGDSLLFVNRLEAGVHWRPLFQQTISLTPLEIDGLIGRVQQTDDERFSFSFITDAFTDGEEVENDLEQPTKPWDVRFPTVELTNIDLRFNDHHDCVYDVRFKRLYIDPQTIDWETGTYALRTLALESPVANIVLCESPQTKEDTSASQPMPSIQVGKLMLNNMSVQFQTIDMFMHLASGDIDIRDAILAEKSIDVHALSLQDIDFAMESQKTEEAPKSGEVILPDWAIAVNDILVDAHRIDINDDLAIRSLNWSASGLSYAPDPTKPTVALSQRLLNFHSETDIPSVNAFAFDLATTAKGIRVTNGHVDALTNTLDFSAEVDYESIKELFQPPFQSRWKAIINSKSLDVNGLETYADLEAIPEFVRHRRWSVTLDAQGKGMDDIDLNHLHLQQPDGFNLSLSGSAEALSNDAKRQFAWTLHHLDINGSLLRDVKALYAPKETNFPRYISVSSRGNFVHKSLSGNLTVNSNIANIQADASNAMGIQRGKGSIDANRLHFGEHTFDNLRAVMTLSADENPMENSSLTLIMESLSVNETALPKIDVRANILQNEYQIAVSGEDPNLHLALDASGRIDSTKITSEFNVDVNAFRPHAFQLTEDVISLSTNFSGNIRFGDIEDFAGRVDIDSLFIQKGKHSINYENIFVDVTSNANAFTLLADLKDLQLDVASNQPLNIIASEMTLYGNHVLGLIDSLPEREVALRSEISVSTGAILQLLGDEYSIGKDTLTLRTNYTRNQTIDMDVSFFIPELHAPGVDLGMFKLEGSGNQHSIDVSLAFDDLSLGRFDMGRTMVNAALSKQTVHFDVANWNKGTLLYRIMTENQIHRDSLNIHILPDSLILNGSNWLANDDNRLHLGEHLRAYNWEIRKDEASLSIVSEQEDNGQGIALMFKNFNVREISAILNPVSPPLEGLLNGNLQQRNRNDVMMTTADIELSGMRVFSQDIGDITVLAELMEDQTIAVDMEVQGPHMDLNIDGFYRVRDDLPDYDLGVELKRLDLKLLELYGGNILRDTEGSIALTAILQGHGLDYTYNGSLRFNKARFNVAAINTPFTLSDEKISVKDQRITFDRFRMLDAKENPLSVDGFIDLKELTNPLLSLSINAKRFRLLGSKRSDNDLFYGDLLVDTEINISEQAREPTIKMNAKLLEGTQLTFIVPESEADVMDRRSVVKIVDRSVPDSLRPRAEALSTLEMGINLDLQLKADPSTRFSIIIDERAGDRLDISGEANLSMQVDPSGAMQLSGLYNITDGAYQLNFYDLVKRKFTLAPNSTIRWNGDPLMAELDINAIYNLRTSPLELMIDQIGPNRELQLPYRRDQPFEVIMNIGGELLQPDLHFDLDMPENARGAVNGTIYSRIQQLKQDENERNQQTFALIVLNQFVPTGRGGPGGGASDMARSSASRMISQQINQLSDRYIKGLDVEVGLDSYTDHEEGQDRTDLNVRVGRSFLDDRLTVQAGGQFELEGSRNAEGNNPNQFMGDVNVEYALTEDGRYRLRAFRRNDWQGAVEGQVITTGASLIFQREFDDFSELVKALWKQKPEHEDND